MFDSSQVVEYDGDNFNESKYLDQRLEKPVGEVRKPRPQASALLTKRPKV